MSRTRTPEHALDAALRSLDAAPPAPLDDLARVRGDAALERALAQGRATGRRPRRDPLVPRPRRTGLRAAALGTAATAAVAGAVLAGVLGGPTTAYASTWVPVPTPASADDVAAAREACAGSATSVAGDRADQLQPRLAERRGDLVLLALDDGGPQPASVVCVVGMTPGGDADFLSGSGGGGVLRPASDGVTDAAIMQQSTPGDELSVIDGLTGERVRAVTVHPADGPSVEATVEGGHYAAWWPGLAVGGGEATGGPVPTYTLDVTLDDGTVLRGIPASGT